MEKEYQGGINYKDIMEIKGLLYLKADTTLVTGKVIRYNKKNEAKKYVLVSKGRPDNLGWIQISDGFARPKESVLGEVVNGAAWVTGAVMVVTGNDLNIPYQQNPANTNNELTDFLKDQNDYTIKAYNEMSDRNDISKNINSVDEKSNGPFEQYNKDGQIRIKGNFIEAEKDGTWEEYYDNGQLRSKGSYIEGEKEGIWQEYHENGNLDNKVKFTEGKKVGLLESYHFDGQVFGRIIYKDGKENGLMEVYHKNGQLMMKGLYKDALQIGKWKYYDENGELIKTENFKN